MSHLLKKKKRLLKKIIRTNFYYLSQLSSRNLPSELFDELTTNGINLFPASWDDLDADCSCPDWAVPCKHIAATIYLISNEIDKNPFLVFEMKGLDLLAEFFKNGSGNNEDITTIDEIIEVGNDNDDKRKIIEEIDFSKIENLKDDIFSVISDKPLFFSGDFKKELKKVYSRIQKELKNYLEENLNSEEFDFKEINSISIKLKSDLLSFNGKIKTNSSSSVLDKKKLHTFSEKDLDNLFLVLNNIPLNEIHNYHDTIIIFSLFYSFTAKLAETGGFIPQLIKLGSNKYIMRYIPALFNKEISKIFEQLKSLIPQNLIAINKQNLKIDDQAIILSSIFLNNFIRKFSLKNTVYEDKISNLFFDGLDYSVTKFEEREIPGTIHLWLSKFYIVHKDYLPLIEILEPKPGESDFGVDIKVEDVKNILSEPVSLKKITTDEKYEAIKFDILKDLSLLSNYFPVVNEYLSRKHQNKLFVAPEKFVNVWFKALPILKLLGIRTLIPKSLQEIFDPQLSLSVKQKVKASAESVVSYFNLGDMLQFDWNIAIGNDSLSAEEFLKATENNFGIIKIKEKYVHIDKKEITKILKSLKNKPKLSPIDILKVNLEGKYNGIKIDSNDEVNKILDDLFKEKKIELPSNLNAKLRDYQYSGFNWLYNNTMNGFGSLIADDMGLGKTIQVITLLLKLKENKIISEKKRALIIVPTSLLNNWEKEFHKFADSLGVHIYHGTARTLKAEGSEIIISTYGTVRSSIELFNKKKWACVVIDEAQNIKNPISAQSKAIKSIKSDVKIAMTGTPVENKLMEYWSIMDFTFKGYLGSKNSFTENYAVPIERFQNREALKDFKKLTAPFILRRMKTDKSIINDLPDKIEINEYCNLTDSQAALYEKVVDEMKIVMNNNKENKTNLFKKNAAVLKLMIILKQICNHPSNYLKKKNSDISLSGKAILLMELLQKIYDKKEKVLIFTQYKEMGDLLVDMINKKFMKEPLFLHGGLNVKKRNEMVEAFQTNPESDTFILSLKAGGTGLNLTKANNVIHFDLWWNPAVENQATDRAFRIGQKKNVLVHRFITKGTFEEKINEIINNKKDLADMSVNTGEKWITDLSNKELSDLVKLER